MEFLPEMKNNQVTVLMADYKTGHILAVDFTVYRKDIPKQTAAIFENIDEANHFITVTTLLHRWIDFTLFDSNHNLLRFIPASP